MDDVARAEEALVEAMARARADQACGEGYFDGLRLGEQQMRAAYERVVLAAAREVTVSVPCSACGGTGEKRREVAGHMVPFGCVKCDTRGTVSRSALAVLMERNLNG